MHIVDAPVGRVSVHFTPAHEAAASTNAFFRIRSNREGFASALRRGGQSNIQSWAKRTESAMGLLSWFEKWLEQPARAAAPAPAPLSDSPLDQAPDESIFRYPVRKVARGLRYVTLASLINRPVTVPSIESADSDLLAVIGDYVDREGSTPPLLHIGGGVHRKYGFLDVYLRGKSELLTKDAMSGIPLLISLGLIGREEGHVSMCPDDFEDMARDIAQMQTHLRLIMVDEGFDPDTLRHGRIGDYTPKFPIQFRITDACVSNCSCVWRWRHFYM